MFVPLHDDTPLRIIRFQYVTVAILIANLVIFLITGAFTSDQLLATVAFGYGIVPSELTGHISSVGFEPIPEPATVFTYMFLHAGWWHLGTNMLFLWVFADNIEDAFGYPAFAIFYILCGVAGGLAHVAMSPLSTSPLIGASGAVAGVLGAYGLLYPKARIWIVLFLRLPIRIGVLWVIGGWLLLQIVSVIIDEGAEVAWWAHIGGFAAGVVITLLLRSKLLIRVGD